MKGAGKIPSKCFKVLKAVTNPAEAIKSEAIHDGVDKNLCYDWLLGDRKTVDEAFAKADKTICPEDGIIALLGYPNRPEKSKTHEYKVFDLVYINNNGQYPRRRVAWLRSCNAT